jgi:hypothetical protein
MGKREWTGLLVAVILAACAGDAADDTGADETEGTPEP